MSNVGRMTVQLAGRVPDINTLPIRLRAARESAGFTQAELAERAGIGRTTISAAESGAKTPGRATMTVWAFATGVDTTWLRTGEVKSPSPDEGEGLSVRHEGFEPPTFCLGAPHLAVVA